MLFGAFGRFALGQFDEVASTAVLTAASGSYALTGQSALFNAKITVAAGSYTISGQPIAFATKTVQSAGAYAITGQSAVVNERLLGAAGSYAITGQAALFATRFPVTAGSYAITGQTGPFTTTEAAAVGSYAISGSAISFKINWVCSPGAYALTGAAASYHELINGAGGDTKIRRPARSNVRLLARKIAVKNDDGSTRKVDLLDRFKPPPPFAFPPDWVVPQQAEAAPIARLRPMPLPLPSQAPVLPASLTSLQELRDEDDLEAIGIVMAAPDPLADQVTALLALLQRGGGTPGPKTSW
jgi:hypothetical protein